MVDNLGSYVALAAAIVIQAVKDTRKGNREAASWLELEGINFFEGITGEKVDLDFWEKWIREGCPGGSTKKLLREKSK